jgi:ERO1-like protein alpha
MHVATNFYDPKLNEEKPNHPMYLNAIGKHPDRVKNLFFLYAVVLRAINRAEPILKSYDYDTKLHRDEDKETPELMQ